MTPDIADLIAGELKVSRGTAYDMMREALAEALAEQQEPVAFLCSFFADPEESFLSFESIRWGTNKPLYASPLVMRKPLTDEEIICIEETIPADVNGVRPPIDFARAIEAAYGIEENKT